MNFPGLDLAWTYGHHFAHSARLIRPWSLSETQDAVGSGAKVLVVATTALGDTLLTTPLVETLSERLGRDRVSLLVKSPYVSLYENDPRLHRVFSVRGKYRWTGLQDNLEDDPHRIALLSNLTEPDLVPFLWGCGVRGFLRYRTRWSRFPRWMANTTMLVRPDHPSYATGHAIENNLAMAKALAIEPTTHRLSLPHLRGPSSGGENLVLIHPGASRGIKRWPAENWARLGDAVAASFGCKIGLTGDSGEIGLANAVAGNMKAPTQIYAGKLGLPELARLQGQSLAFLSGDTGPYHLAISVGCATATLFAPTDRGSSVEACGPHQAHATYHRALQTTTLGDSIVTLPFDKMLEISSGVIAAALERRTKGTAVAPSPETA